MNYHLHLTTGAWWCFPLSGETIRIPRSVWNMDLPLAHPLSAKRFGFALVDREFGLQSSMSLARLDFTKLNFLSRLSMNAVRMRNNKHVHSKDSKLQRLRPQTSLKNPTIEAMNRHRLGRGKYSGIVKLMEEGRDLLSIAAAA